MNTKTYSVNQETFEAVMNASDEQIVRLFADMGIEIDLDKPFDDDDEGYILDEL